MATAQDGASAADKNKPAVTSSGEQVSIASRGADIRGVLFDLFSQSKKSFVLEPNTRFVLYLALTDVGFDEALEIICHTANFKYEINSGIYYISQATKETTVKPKPETAPTPLGKISDKDLTSKITTRLSRADIRRVFQEFQSQSGVIIEVDKRVPDYKIDAFLVSTSLKYSLDVITRAAGLIWVKTDNKSILIQPKQ